LGSQGGNAFRVYLFGIALLVYLVGLSYLVHVVGRSAKGEKKMSSGPDSIDPIDLAATGLVALCAMLVVFFPVILLNGYLVFRTFSEQRTPGALWFLNVPLVLVALVYYPMALGMSAVWHNKWLALRPDVVVSHILKIRRDYAILVLAIAVIGGVQFALEMIARSVPFLGGILAHMSTAYLAVIEAHILGWTLYMNSRELGWT
jgi:arginine exporter protein ArgO